MDHTTDPVPASNAVAASPRAPGPALPLAFLRQLGAGRVATLALTGLGLLGFFAYLLVRVVEPEYALLYAGLDLEDSAEIVARLEAENVPYRLRADGATILVPAEAALRLRMSLAEAGLPGGGSVGYEIFDELSAFGTTNFLADVNLKRALEGELARTIGALADVKAARVHLVTPRRELFRRERIEPTASVTLKMQGGRRLARRQVLAIQHIVAAAVPGLDAARITLVDDRGNLLARGGDLDRDSLIASETEEFRTAYEERLKRTIEELVGRSLGAERVRAEVHAEMDFDRVTTTEETYDPDGRVVRSTQSVEEEIQAAERDRNEGVSVANNLPNTGVAEAAGRTSSENTTRAEETVNYEISRTVRNHTQVGGRVRRLSVAVLVDGRMVPNDDGELVRTDLAEGELEQIGTLVRSTVGYDAARGDVVEVINMPFDAPPPVAVDEPWIDIDKYDVLRLIELVVLAAIALVLILLVIRPAMRHLLPSVTEPGFAGAAAGGAAVALHGGPDADAPAALPAPEGRELVPAPNAWVEIDQVEGQVSADLVQRAIDAIQHAPDDVTGILRTWLHES